MSKNQQYNSFVGQTQVQSSIQRTNSNKQKNLSSSGQNILSFNNQNSNQASGISLYNTQKISSEYLVNSSLNNNISN